MPDTQPRPKYRGRASAVANFSNPTWKSDVSPNSARASAMPVADAARAAMATRCSKRCTSSSRTKTAPAIGALNAAARPAPAPAASRTRQSGQVRPKEAPRKNAAARPNLHTWTLTAEGESGPDRKDSADELYRHQSERRRRQFLAQDRLD